MKLATINHQGAPTAVVVDGDAAYPLPTSLAHLIDLGLARALEIGDQARHGEPIPFAEADLLLPYKPPSVRDFVTFESHVEGVRKSIDNAVGIPEAWYDAPTFYFTNPHALYGPGRAITRPATCRRGRAAGTLAAGSAAWNRSTRMSSVPSGPALRRTASPERAAVIVPARSRAPPR